MKPLLNSEMTVPGSTVVEAVSNMAPQPIDLGLIPQAAGETLEQFEKWPILRALLLWLLFAAVLAGLFYATR